MELHFPGLALLERRLGRLGITLPFFILRVREESLLALLLCLILILLILVIIAIVFRDFLLFNVLA